MFSNQIFELDREFMHVDGCNDCRSLIRIYLVTYSDGSQDEDWVHTCPWDEQFQEYED